jgi:hypothetical protein
MTHLKSKAIAVGILYSATIPAAYAQSDHSMTKPDDMKWAATPSLPCGAQMALIEGPLNEAKPFMFRVKFPANCKIAPHYHPAVEHVTVMSGGFGMGIGDVNDPAKGMLLPAGSVSILQPGTHHFAWTTGETVLQVHGVGPWGITYVNPADDPAKKTN